MNHSLNQLARRGLDGTARPAEIEVDRWLGMGVFVLPGVAIGRGSVVAAGAVVAKDVPPFTLHLGNLKENRNEDGMSNEIENSNNGIPSKSNLHRKEERST